MRTQPRALFGPFFHKKRPHTSNDTPSKRQKKIEFCVPSDDDDDEVFIVETTNKSVLQDEGLKSGIFKVKKRMEPTKLTTMTHNKPVQVNEDEEIGNDTTLLMVDSDAEDCKPAAAPSELSKEMIPLQGQAIVDSEEGLGTVSLQRKSSIESEEEGPSLPTIDSLKNALLTADSYTEDCKPAAAPSELSRGTIPLQGQASVESEEGVGTVPLQRQSSIESDEEGPFPPFIDSLKNTCWKCSVKFKLAKDEFCLYALHTHPLLKVPICSVCADEVLAVEIQSLEGDWCSGCGRHEDDVEMLLLCDDCPRAFCDLCTALAHGGGEQGQKEVDRLAESDDSWSCLYCRPPFSLQILQSHTERLGLEEETRQRTVDDIMLELDKVELERLECEKMALPKVLDQQRDEFRNELRKTISSPDDMEEAVEMEMQAWQEMWFKHDQRLADLAASLQDELEMQENVDLAACYETLQGKTLIDSVDPAWKKAADAAIEQREQEEDENDEPPVGK